MFIVFSRENTRHTFNILFIHIRKRAWRLSSYTENARLLHQFIQAEASTAPRHTSLAPMFPHPDQGVSVAHSTVNEFLHSMDELALKQQRKTQKNQARRARRGKKGKIAAPNIPTPGVNGSATPLAITHLPSQEFELGEQTSKVDQPKPKRRQRRHKQMLETELSEILAETNLTSPNPNAENSAAPSQTPTANITSPEPTIGITVGDKARYLADTTPGGEGHGIGALAATSACHFQQSSKPALRGDAAVFQQKYPEFNIVPSYNALPIAPLGTQTNAFHNAFSAPSVVSSGLGILINTVPSTNQPARDLSTKSLPKATRRKLQSTDPQSRPTKRSPSAQKPKRQKSPAKFPITSHEKPLPPPTPSPLYLSQANLEPAPLSKSQRLLLVLDLNGTLLYRPRCSSSYRARPSLEPFLSYCLAQHSVLIWSSATAPNVATICSRIFTSTQQQQLLGEWGRDTLDLTTEQYYSKCQVYKRLERIWDGRALRDSHPSRCCDDDEKWSQKNTLLLDDSAVKGQAQPYNLVELPEFTRTGETDQGGKEVLGQVVAYLEEARQWADISAFVRKWPFKVDAGWKWDWELGRRVW